MDSPGVFSWLWYFDATEIWFQEHFTQDCSLRKRRTHSHWAKANAKVKKIKKSAKEIKEKNQTLKKTFAFARSEWALTNQVVCFVRAIPKYSYWQSRPSLWLTETVLKLLSPWKALEATFVKLYRFSYSFMFPRNAQSWQCWHFYRPQLLLWKGNVFRSACHSVHRSGGGVHPPWADTPMGRQPPGRLPSGQTPPPTWADTPTPSREMATAADGTHPIGMPPGVQLLTEINW